MIKSIYIIGSLRNPKIPEIANAIEARGIEAFCDWFQPGPEADDFWKKYSEARGLTYSQALKSHGANQIFDFDKAHLDRCDAAVMVAPAGKSGHLELGYTIGKGKPGYILFDGEPERWDVMVKFATGVFFSLDELFVELTAPGDWIDKEPRADGRPRRWKPFESLPATDFQLVKQEKQNGKS